MRFNVYMCGYIIIIILYELLKEVNVRKCCQLLLLPERLRSVRLCVLLHSCWCSPLTLNLTYLELSSGMFFHPQMW